ncbi:MAG TPA: ABC transporter ATP-binding protein [Puia sp.]|nr:ABC transporter ATP-binding protein [Puia sp.]
MENAVQIEMLVKTYHGRRGTVSALQDISFDVPPGEIFGLIGPDGAGKTSLFRILTTLLLPDSGQARVNGFDIIREFRKIRQCVGYMPGRFSLYQDLSVEENLRFFASIFKVDIEKNYGLIRDIYDQIKSFSTRRAGQLSGGMKQKLALCCALIHRPAVLFLDEPTTGVDAVSRKEFWEMLHRLKEQGIAILVSTPYMDEAGLCDRVALIQKGSILSIDSPAGIREKFGKPLWAVRAAEMYHLMIALQQDPAVESCYPFGQYHHVVFRSPGDDQGRLTQVIQQGNYTDAEVQAIAPGIEDCFMALMKTA